MQNFDSPASKFCHLIAGQKLAKSAFLLSAGQSLKLVHGPNAHPIFWGWRLQRSRARRRWWRLRRDGAEAQWLFLREPDTRKTRRTRATKQVRTPINSNRKESLRRRITLQLQAKPVSDTLFNRHKLCWRQAAKFTERQFVGNGNQALNDKNAPFEEGNINGNSKFRTAKCRRMRNNGDERAVGVLEGMFRIKAGRTFCAMPRSTSQTSPRRGIFLLVVQGEDAGGGGGQLVIRGRGIIELGRAVKNDAAELPLLAGRKLLEFFKQMRGRCAHAEKIICLFSRASWKMGSLEAHPLDFLPSRTGWSGSGGTGAEAQWLFLPEPDRAGRASISAMRRKSASCGGCSRRCNWKSSA
jgi:hypothetical protein